MYKCMCTVHVWWRIIHESSLMMEHIEVMYAQKSSIIWWQSMVFVLLTFICIGWAEFVIREKFFDCLLKWDIKSVNIFLHEKRISTHIHKGLVMFIVSTWSAFSRLFSDAFNQLRTLCVLNSMPSLGFDFRKLNIITIKDTLWMRKDDGTSRRTDGQKGTQSVFNLLENTPSLHFPITPLFVNWLFWIDTSQWPPTISCARVRNLRRNSSRCKHFVRRDSGERNWQFVIWSATLCTRVHLCTWSVKWCSNLERVSS